MDLPETQLRDRKKSLLIILIPVVALGIFLWFALLPFQNKEGNKEEEPPPENPTHAKLRLETPLQTSVITSPLTLKGEAKGTWYFEGDFPIILTDWDGKIIAEHYATALEPWMTEEFVPFKASLEFETPEFGDIGSLILRKDNPTGRPEFDDAYEIPIRFR